jgi:hypothetical protein
MLAPCLFASNILNVSPVVLRRDNIVLATIFVDQTTPPEAIETVGPGNPPDLQHCFSTTVVYRTDCNS